MPDEYDWEWRKRLQNSKDASSKQRLVDQQRHARDMQDRKDRTRRKESQEKATQQQQVETIKGQNSREIMERQHELDEENRLRDHKFNRAEDKRELVKLAGELSIRRRDDRLRAVDQSEASLAMLEGAVLELVAQAMIHQEQTKLDHRQNLERIGLESREERRMETHKHGLNKRYDRFQAELDRQNAQHTEAELAAAAKVALAEIETSNSTPVVNWVVEDPAPDPRYQSPEPLPDPRDTANTDNVDFPAAFGWKTPDNKGSD